MNGSPIAEVPGQRIRVRVPDESGDKIRDIHDGQTGTVVGPSTPTWGGESVEVLLDARRHDGGEWRAHYPVSWLLPENRCPTCRGTGELS